jgi:hypothetical protein
LKKMMMMLKMRKIEVKKKEEKYHASQWNWGGENDDEFFGSDSRVLVVEERRFGMGLNWTLIIHFGKRGKFFIFFPFGYKQLIL